MTKTPVSPDLLQSLEILTELVVKDIGHNLDKEILLNSLVYILDKNKFDIF